MHFVDLVIDKQDILSCKERWDGVLALIPDCILWKCNDLFVNSINVLTHGIANELRIALCVLFFLVT